MSRHFTLTTLSENSVLPGSARGLIAEHGLAILIGGREKTLFDTGQGKAVLHNASILGINLQDIDKIVLSHGHYDHTGGLKEVLKETGEVEVIAHPDILADKRARSRGREKYIGVPFTRDELEAVGARFTLKKGPIEVSRGILSTGEIERKTPFEDADERLFVNEGGRLVLDLLMDDQSLILDTSKGLVIVCGCAHSGIINTIEHAKALTGHNIYAVVGGIHLANASESCLEKTIHAFNALGVKRLELSHCTGMKAYMRFAREFGDGFGINSAGKKLEF